MESDLRGCNLLNQASDPVQRLSVGDARCQQPVMCDFVVVLRTLIAHGLTAGLGGSPTLLSVTDSCPSEVDVTYNTTS
jgi:hypothetical protein